MMAVEYCRRCCCCCRLCAKHILFIFSLLLKPHNVCGIGEHDGRRPNGRRLNWYWWRICISFYRLLCTLYYKRIKSKIEYIADNKQNRFLTQDLRRTTYCTQHTRHTYKCKARFVFFCLHRTHRPQNQFADDWCCTRRRTFLSFNFFGYVCADADKIRSSHSDRSRWTDCVRVDGWIGLVWFVTTSTQISVLSTTVEAGTTLHECFAW